MDCVPKVTDDHLCARREQVLAAAWICFARDGFHATTMADVIRQSGLSAGAVYRYFSGKDALIGATTDRALGTAQQELAQALRDGDPTAPAATIGDIVTRIERIAQAGPIDATRLALQAWAEALRSPMVRITAERAQKQLRGALVDYVERCRAAGTFPPGSDPAETAQAMLSLVMGFLVQRLLVDDVDAGSYRRALAAILP
jgi:AcrR family transcriptional regulator